MKKTVGILVFHDVEVLDFAGPFEVFSVASQLHSHQLFDVRLIAKEMTPVIAVNGLSLNPHHSYEEAPPLDILIVAGGAGTRALLRDTETLRWVKRNIKQAQLSMSICSGSRVLGKLGLLDHRPYCTHQGVYTHMSELVPSGKPQYDKRFVASAPNLYTSGGISAGIDLSFYIVEQLHGKATAKTTASYMEYKGYIPKGND